MVKAKVILTIAACIGLSGCQLSDRFFGSSSGSDERRPPVAEDSESTRYEFRYSTQANRSASEPLDGVTLDVQGEYYIFLQAPDNKNGSVKFFINDVEVNSDNRYPYDLNGGGTLATAQNMSLFSEGVNQVSAQFKGRIVDQVTVTVENTTVVEPEPEPAPEPSYSLMMSTNADRSGGSAIDGATLDSAGDYYIFLDTNDTAAETVRFYLNGNLIQTEYDAPWDAAGGTETTANAVDMAQFVDGSNTMSVEVDGVRVASATVTVETTVVEEPAPEPTYSLMLSTSADRSGATSLDGATLDSTAIYYVFLQTDDTAAETVRFYLDGSLVRTDEAAPWDLAGGTDVEAIAVDMSLFSDGPHTLTVTVNGTEVAAASLTVETPVDDTTPDTIDITLYWNPPIERENGSSLPTSDLGGYEIRYREEGAADFESVVINDGSVDQYLFQGLQAGNYQFEIAAFDQNGVYSEFVSTTY